ncbi:short-chain dehydrogenase/reductase SDR [Parafrankia sp. EAN1pec]|nr:short-chain dehydrogenase/reductase SDR [Frankia sp. EAN1pec]
MKTVVITGGTDGMGAALARHYLREGNRVVVVGRNRAKFEALLSSLAADGVAATGRASFLAADLSLVAESERVVEQIWASHERIDVLVLAASFIRQKRHETAEGHEASWVLFFVSKYILLTGLASLLAESDRPTVVNTSVPGAKAGAIDFDDLESAQRFSFARSNAQQRRANELLGILVTSDNPALAYITWGPRRLVRTSLAGDVGRAMKIASVLLGAVAGQRPDDAIAPIITFVADPHAGRAAYRGATQVALVQGPHDTDDARRLAEASPVRIFSTPSRRQIWSST